MPTDPTTLSARNQNLVLAASAIGVLTVALGMSDESAKQALAELEGKWQLVSSEYGGEQAAAEHKEIWHFTGNRLIRSIKQKEYAATRVEVWPKKDPMQMDFVPTKDGGADEEAAFETRTKCLYSLKGDELRIALTFEFAPGTPEDERQQEIEYGNIRPRSVDSSGRVMVLTLKRVKAAGEPERTAASPSRRITRDDLIGDWQSPEKWSDYHQGEWGLTKLWWTFRRDGTMEQVLFLDDPAAGRGEIHVLGKYTLNEGRLTIAQERMVLISEQHPWTPETEEMAESVSAECKLTDEGLQVRFPDRELYRFAKMPRAIALHAHHGDTYDAIPYWAPRRGPIHFGFDYVYDDSGQLVQIRIKDD